MAGLLSFHCWTHFREVGNLSSCAAPLPGMLTALHVTKGPGPAPEGRGATDRSKGHPETPTFSRAGRKRRSVQSAVKWVYLAGLIGHLRTSSPTSYLVCTGKSWGHHHQCMCHPGHPILAHKHITSSLSPARVPTFLICLALQSCHWAVKDRYCLERWFECHGYLKILQWLHHL